MPTLEVKMGTGSCASRGREGGQLRDGAALSCETLGHALIVGVLVAVAVCGCDSPPPPPDAAVPGPDSGGSCAADSECDDGLFCTGSETCRPADPSADSRGCVAAPPPCLAGQVCDDTADRCMTSCVGDADADGDGARAAECDGDDCDDSDATRFPGNPEICDADGHDEDCNAATFGDRDLDGDGEVDRSCFNVAADGTRSEGTDCDDTRRSVHSTASEVCDGFDNNCDGEIDEGTQVAGFVDEDRDGHGDPTMPIMACAGARRFALEDDDCDDTNPARRPNWIELCDGLDNDCDGEIDEAPVPVAWFVDVDGDGWGTVSDTAPTLLSCEPIPGRAIRGGDCNDADPMISPSAAERCNALDDDCDGVANFFLAPGDTEDDDRDGAADMACGAGALDCDDRDPYSGSSSVELCDGRDNDCDGRVDEDVQDVSWFVDADRDGFGAGAAVSSCEIQVGRVLRDGDCDDTSAAVSPAALDGCDGMAGVDDDCDSLVDESLLESAYYTDEDGDGWGAGAAVLACGAPSGHVALPGDCRPLDATLSPGATELCTNGLDEDCDDLFDCDDADCAADASCALTAMLSLVSGAGQSALVHALTAAEVVVELRDLGGAALEGVEVTCSSVSGASCATFSATTDASGRARFRLRAPPFPGSQRVRIGSAGARSVFPDVRATAPAAGTIYTLLNVGEVTGVAFDAATRPAADVGLTATDSVRAVATDDLGNIYVALYNEARILQITPTGVARIFAGAGSFVHTGDLGAALDAGIPYPSQLVFDRVGGRLIVAGNGGATESRIRAIDLATGVIDPLGGGGGAASPAYGDEGPGADAQLEALALAVEADGSVAFADGVSGRARRIDPFGLVHDVPGLVGDVPGGTARALTSSGMASGPNGLVMGVFADVGWLVTRAAAAAPERVLGVLSTGTPSDMVPARSVRLDGISGLLATSDENLLFADPGSARVRRVEHSTSLVTTLAGTGTSGAPTERGAALSSALRSPYGIALLPAGHLVIADGSGVRIVWGPVDRAAAVVNVTLNGGDAQSSTAFAAFPMPFSVRARTAAGAAVRGVVAEFESDRLWTAPAETLSTGVAASALNAWIQTGPAEIRARVLDLWGRSIGADVVGSATVTAPALGTIVSILNRGGLGAPYSGTTAGAFAATSSLSFVGGIATSGSEIIIGGSGVGVLAIDARGALRRLSTYDCGSFGDLAIDAPRGALVCTVGTQIHRVDLATGGSLAIAGGGASTMAGALLDVDLASPSSVAVSDTGQYLTHGCGGYVWSADLATDTATPIIQSGAGDASLMYQASCGSYGAITSLPGGDVVVMAGFIGTAAGGAARNGLIRWAAATGLFTRLADDREGISAYVQGLLPDGAGNLYFSDVTFNRVMRINLTTRVLTRIAGSATGVFGATGDGGPATSALLATPSQLALLDGHLLIADTGNGRIRLVW